MSEALGSLAEPQGDDILASGPAEKQPLLSRRMEKLQRWGLYASWFVNLDLSRSVTCLGTYSATGHTRDMAVPMREY